MVGWLKNAVIYHVLIDRFAGYDEERARDWDSPIFTGGSLRGVIGALPYLQQLNVSALFLSSFCTNTAYHGYHITDHRTVDSRFGNLDELRALVDKCHEVGIRVIADFVPNHCHESHEFFRAALAGDSKYRHWFFFDKQNRHAGFLGERQLPKFDLDDPGAAAYMIETALQWLGLGIDGLRIDHAVGVSRRFLRALYAETRAAFPESALLGEAMVTRRQLRKYHRTLRVRRKSWRRWMGFTQEGIQRDYVGIIDGVFDFEFASLAKRYVKGELSREQLTRRLHTHFKGYPRDFALALLLDNHDMNRFMFECRGDASKYREAIEIMFEAAKQYSQPVSLYYGSEVLMGQLGPIDMTYAYSDLLARKPMNWRPNKQQLEFRSLCAEHIRTLRERDTG